MKVYFFIHSAELAEKLNTVDPYKEWADIEPAMLQIIMSAYNLNKQGEATVFVSDLPSDGILIYHIKDTEIVRQKLAHSMLKSTHLVQYGEKPGSKKLAEKVIIPTPVSSPGNHHKYIPEWRHPAVIERNTQRKFSIETIMLIEMNWKLHPYFESDAWNEWVSGKNIEVRVHDRSDPSAYNYKSVDALIVYPSNGDRNSKQHCLHSCNCLINGWHAGVPVIIYPHEKVTRLHRSPLDFISVTDPSEVPKALMKLESNPELYEAMVENGRQRAWEYNDEHILYQWISKILT